MSASMPPREAAAAILFSCLLATTVGLARGAGAGPLGDCAAVACAGGALLAPSLGARRFAWGLLPLLIGVPILLAVSYGHTLPELGGCLLLFALCTTAGALGAAPRFYLPAMLLLFAAPYAMGYLVEEFGNLDAVGFWRTLSPFAAARTVAGGEALSPVGLLLLAAWPVGRIVRRGK